MITTNKSRAARTDPVTGCREEACFFGDGDEALFGVTHVPPTEPVAGLVVCGSISAEFQKNYRREVLLSRKLVAQGVAVQRFHYRGVGESDGDRLKTTFASMCEDAVTAAGQLRAICKSAPIAYLGTRMGALVAASAASHDGGPVMFWQPVADPRKFFNEVFRAYMAQAMREEGAGALTTSTLLDQLKRDDYLDVLGHTLPRSVYETTIEQRLSGLVGDKVRELGLIQVGQTEELRRELASLVDNWRGEGREVSVSIFKGSIAWWANVGGDQYQPESKRAINRRLLETTSDWVASIPGAPGSGESAAGPDPATTTPQIHGRSSNRQPTYFNAGAEDLFGVITFPSEGAKRTGVTLLEAGGNTLTAGRNQWGARLSEALAEIGCYSMRFSYQGIADSGGDVDDFVLDRPQAEEACAAVRRLAEEGVEQHALVGFCFGACGAVAAAAQDERIEALVLLDMPLRSAGRGVATATKLAYELSAADYVSRGFRRIDVRSLASWAQWKRYARLAAVLAGAKLQALRRKALRTPEDPAPWLSQRLLEDLEAVVHRNVRIVFLYGEEDDELEDFRVAREGRLGALLDSAAHPIHVEIQPGKTHGSSSASQALLIDYLAQWGRSLS